QHQAEKNLNTTHSQMGFDPNVAKGKCQQTIGHLVKLGSVTDEEKMLEEDDDFCRIAMTFTPMFSFKTQRIVALAKSAHKLPADASGAVKNAHKNHASKCTISKWL